MNRRMTGAAEEGHGEMNPAYAEPEGIQVMATSVAPDNMGAHFLAVSIPHLIAVKACEEQPSFEMFGPGGFLGPPAKEFRLWKTFLL